jgi:hypothetical protein
VSRETVIESSLYISENFSGNFKIIAYDAKVLPKKTPALKNAGVLKKGLYVG